jgi:hypothetical protein
MAFPWGGNRKGAFNFDDNSAGTDLCPVPCFAKAKNICPAGQGTNYKFAPAGGYIKSLPKDFQRWFHRFWKDPSAPNVPNSEIDEALKIWKSMGKPKIK